MTINEYQLEQQTTRSLHLSSYKMGSWASTEKQWYLAVSTDAIGYDLETHISDERRQASDPLPRRLRLRAKRSPTDE